MQGPSTRSGTGPNPSGDRPAPRSVVGTTLSTPACPCRAGAWAPRGRLGLRLRGTPGMVGRAAEARIVRNPPATRETAIIPEPKRQRWMRLGLDSAAVLVSILTAFAIDAGWARHQAEQEERTALTRLLAEFEANRPELEAVRSGHQRVHDWGVELLRAGYGMSDPVPEQARKVRVLLGMSVFYDPSSGALNRFLVEQQQGLIAGPELLDRLAGFPAKVDELWQQEELLRSMISSQIEPFVVGNADRLSLLPPATSSDALQALRSELVDSGADQEIADLVNDPQVRNLVSTRVILEAQSLLKFERLATEFDLIAAEIAEALGPPAS